MLFRSLSPDPYVPNPGNSQSFNRYSYVRNNPLTFTDPSGFVPCLDGITTVLCKSIVLSVVGAIFGKLFGGGHGHPPPKGCFVQGTGCYGKASSSKLFDMVTDILDGPLKSYGRYDESIWAGCQYCLSAAEVVADSQTDVFNVKGSVGIQVALGVGVKGALSVGGIANAAAFEYDFGDGRLRKTVEIGVALDLPRVTLIEGGVRASVPARTGRNPYGEFELYGDFLAPTDDFILNFSLALVWGIDIEVNLSELGRRVRSSEQEVP